MFFRFICTKNSLIVFLLIFATFFPVVAETRTSASFEETLRFYEQLKSNSPPARKSEAWDVVGRNFYGMYSWNPGSELAPLSLFLAAEVYYYKTIKFDSPRDEEKAFEYLREFLTRYPPDHDLADDSLLLMGLIFERRAKESSAIRAYLSVVDGRSDPNTYEIARKRLEVLLQSRRSSPSGTGVLISGEKGLILTNNHVVENCGRVQVVAGRNRTEMPSSVISADAKNDIALIKVYSEKLWDSDINKWLDATKTGNVPSIEKGFLRK